MHLLTLTPWTVYLLISAVAEQKSNRLSEALRGEARSRGRHHFCWYLTLRDCSGLLPCSQTDVSFFSCWVWWVCHIRFDDLACSFMSWEAFQKVKIIRDTAREYTATRLSTFVDLKQSFDSWILKHQREIFVVRSDFRFGVFDFWGFSLFVFCFFLPFTPFPCFLCCLSFASSLECSGIGSVEVARSCLAL